MAWLKGLFGQSSHSSHPDTADADVYDALERYRESLTHMDATTMANRESNRGAEQTLAELVSFMERAT